MAFSQGYCDNPTAHIDSEEIQGHEMSNELITDSADDDSMMDEDDGTLVGHGSNEGAKAARKKQWQNIALAVGAVAIAVTALILVANNNGKSSHHHKD